MASRPSLHPARKSPPSPAASIGSVHCDNILRNFRQEEVVYALMTQLREKESELTLLSEQRHVALQQQQLTEQTNIKLNSQIDLHNKALAEKDTKIAVLEQKLVQQKKGNESAIADANLKHLTETNMECRRMLEERDDELSQLRPILTELKEKVDEFESNVDVQKNEKLEGELNTVKGELAIARDQQMATNGTVEELAKKIKGKEWMIKSLQDESDDQRSRENHMLAHIKKLNEKIKTYETKFKGKGVDVPMLLAKLKDYEARTKEMQGEVRRLTNKKLNELVVRSASPQVTDPIETQADDMIKNSTASTTSESKDDADNESNVADSYSFVNSEQDEEATEEEATEEEATFTSITTDMYGVFSPESRQDEGVLGEFLSDVKVGIQDMQTEGLCCAMRTSPHHLNSPRSYGSPASYQSQRSLASYESSRAFASRNNR